MTMFRSFRPIADRPEAAPVRHTPVSAPQIAGPTDRNQLIALQRMAGNRAAATFVALQRCGPIAADQCPCEADAGGGGTRDAAEPTKPSGGEQQEATTQI